MDTDGFINLALLLLFLVASGFFSGSEVSLFSIDNIKIKDLKKENNIFAKTIISLLDAPRRLLVTILIGNTLVNVGTSIIAVTFAFTAAEYFKISIDVAIILQIVVTTIVILIVGEITPKVWAAKHPIGFAKIVAVPLYWVSVILFPIAKVLTDLIKFITSKMNLNKGNTALFPSEINDLAEISLEKGTIEEGEQELIQGIVSFKTVTVREVMTPRVDIVAVSSDTDFDELIRIVTESGHSRIPLFKDNIDEIEGIIYAKDLLPYFTSLELRKKLLLTKIARKAMFIPENKLISDLMQDFQKMNMHVGIVVDEYGGTAGLITMEDILEEIVGEIKDEYDDDEQEISVINDNEYLVVGKVSIDEINNLLQTDLSSENDDYDTIAGFIFNHSGKIPELDYKFVFKDYQFAVKEITNNRINKIHILKVISKELDA